MGELSEIALSNASKIMFDAVAILQSGILFEVSWKYDQLEMRSLLLRTSNDQELCD